MIARAAGVDCYHTDTHGYVWGDRLFETVGTYMELRPWQEQPSLRPFFKAMKEDDRAAASDSGAASHLGVVWQALQDLKASGSWSIDSIPGVCSFA